MNDQPTDDTNGLTQHLNELQAVTNGLSARFSADTVPIHAAPGRELNEREHARLR